jgi:hypothetical protein
MASWGALPPISGLSASRLRLSLKSEAAQIQMSYKVM